MKLTGRGIGWLIAGALVCASSIETDNIPGTVGTFAIGLVFVAVYFIKQRCDPCGIGWFIAGGIFLAFSLEELLTVLGGFISRFPTPSDNLSNMLIGFIVALALLYVFYRKNRDELQDVAEVIGDEDYYEPSYQEEVTEETVVEEIRQTVTTESVVKPGPATKQDETDSILEFEVIDGD